MRSRQKRGETGQTLGDKASKPKAWHTGDGKVMVVVVVMVMVVVVVVVAACVLWAQVLCTPLTWILYLILMTHATGLVLSLLHRWGG